MKALLIKKGDIEWIDIPKDFSAAQAEELLNTSEWMSSSIRFLKDFRFRVYHKDTVLKPKFYSAMNEDASADIPEEAIFVLTERYHGEDEEFLNINPLVEKLILDNLMTYDVDGVKQPILQWNK